jgi:hypothetical protein
MGNAGYRRSGGQRRSAMRVNHAGLGPDHGIHGTAHPRHSSASWNPVRRWQSRCSLLDPSVRWGDGMGNAGYRRSGGQRRSAMRVNHAGLGPDHGIHGTAHLRHSSASWNPVRRWQSRCSLLDPSVRWGDGMGNAGYRRSGGQRRSAMRVNHAGLGPDHGIHGTSHHRHSSASWNPVRRWQSRCSLLDPSVRWGDGMGNAGYRRSGGQRRSAMRATNARLDSDHGIYTNCPRAGRLRHPPRAGAGSKPPPTFPRPPAPPRRDSPPAARTSASRRARSAP